MILTLNNCVEERELIRTLYTDFYSLWDHKPGDDKDQTDLLISFSIAKILHHDCRSIIEYAEKFSEEEMLTDIYGDTDDDQDEIYNVNMVVVSLNIEAKGIDIKWK